MINLIPISAQREKAYIKLTLIVVKAQKHPQHDQMEPL